MCPFVFMGHEASTVASLVINTKIFCVCLCTAVLSLLNILFCFSLYEAAVAHPDFLCVKLTVLVNL